MVRTRSGKQTDNGNKIAAKSKAKPKTPPRRRLRRKPVNNTKAVQTPPGVRSSNRLKDKIEYDSDSDTTNSPESSRSSCSSSSLSSKNKKSKRTQQQPTQVRRSNRLLHSTNNINSTNKPLNSDSNINTRNSNSPPQNESRKRKLSTKAKKKGTPPKKRKAVRHSTKSIMMDDSPSKMLSRRMSKLTVNYSRTATTTVAAQINAKIRANSNSNPKPAKNSRKSRRNLTPTIMVMAEEKMEEEPGYAPHDDDDDDVEEKDYGTSDDCKQRETVDTKRNHNSNRNSGRSRGRSQSRRQQLLQVQQMLVTQDMTNLDLKGREIEYSTIISFLKQNLKQRQSNSFYICGSPGTGKTATMLQIEKYLSQHRSALNIAKVIKMNAMRFAKPQRIYTTLYQEIVRDDGHHNNHNDNDNHSGAPSLSLSAFDAIKELNTLLVEKKTHRRKMYVLIIDECDGLLASQQSTLYQLFLWCKKLHSRLVLVGIANSIDLTDRFLPKLRARKCEPHLLIFKPYTKHQLLAILKYRLQYSCKSVSASAAAAAVSAGDTDGTDPGVGNTDDIPYFDAIALEICAQKVAKMYGDLRKCLEICRSALNILIDDNTKDKISFADMRLVLRDSFSSPLIEVIRELPNHQKILIVIMSMLGQRCICTTDTNLLLFYKYCVLKCHLPKCSSSEFSIMIDSLIADGIIKVIQRLSIKHNFAQNHNNASVSKNISMHSRISHRKLQIVIPKTDVAYAVQDNKLLTKLFDSNFFIPNRFIQ